MVCCLSVGSLFVIATPAHGSPRAQAAKLYDEGMRHFSLSEYPQAIQLFSQAYKIYPKAGFLYNIAQAYRLHGDCSKAYRLYQSYLREAPKASNRSLAEKQRDDMKTCAAHAPRMTRPPSQQRQADSVALARTQNRNVTTGRGKRIAGVVSITAGAALLAGAGIFAARAVDASREINDLFTMGGTWTAGAAATQKRGRRDQTISWISAAGGIVAVTTGITLYAVGRRQRTRARSRLAVTSTGLAWSGVY